MKPCIILSLMLTAAAGLHAQERPPASSEGLQQRKLLEAYRDKVGNLEPFVRVRPLRDTSLNDAVRKRLYAQGNIGKLQATLSHQTARGKVYTLSPDNMPCLAPDMKAVAPMPNRKELFVEDKGSRLRMRPIIPQDEDKNKR